jgi:hypothetical protein
MGALATWAQRVVKACKGGNPDAGDVRTLTTEDVLALVDACEEGANHSSTQVGALKVGVLRH